MNEKILRKYAKVMQMALRGEPNEAATAANIAAEMRVEYPWLAKAYAEQTETDDKTDSAPNHGTREADSGWNWNDVFGIAKEAAQKAREFTHAMADTEAAVDMADGTEMKVYQNERSMSWHIDTEFSAQDIEVLQDMNPLQLRTYVDSLTERYREWLGQLFLDD
jgi:hypothetical protein